MASLIDHQSRFLRRLCLGHHRFSELVERGNRFHCTVSIFDIDHFKKYNDGFGHDFGDFVLKAFSQQSRDRLSEKTIFARIGGEEFCIVDYSGSAETAADEFQGALDLVLDRQL